MLDDSLIATRKNEKKKSYFCWFFFTNNSNLIACGSRYEEFPTRSNDGSSQKKKFCIFKFYIINWNLFIT